jgi:hypothetical protein
VWSLENSQFFYSFYSHVQNHDSGKVLVGQGDPTIIMVFNGKISSMVKEQIWLQKF